MNAKSKNNKPVNSYGFTKRLTTEIVEQPIIVGGKVVDDYKAITNKQTGVIYSIPKKTYTPVNNEKFMQIAEEFALATGYELDGYSEWNGGAKVLAYLQKGGNKENIMGFDCENHVVISNSHDGRSSFWVGFCNKFTRCRNEFGKILQLSERESMKISHSKHSAGRIEAITNQFALIAKNQENFVMSLEAMKAVRLKTAHTAEVFKILGLDTKSKSTRMINIIDSFQDCLDIETGDLGKNLFALFNGVTRYTTHVRQNKHKVYGKFHSTANILDNKAFESIKKMIV